MATAEQLATALRNADAAGDTEAATKLATALKQMRGGGPDFSQATAPSERPQLQDALQAKASAAGAPNLAWGDVAGQALKNAPASAGRFAGDIANIFMHPIDTAQNVIGLGAGAVEKLIPGEQGQEKYADALGQFFADRYGGMDKLKQTMATDPVGFLSDLSMVFSGGSMAAAKVPMIGSKVAKVANVASRVADPFTAVGKVGKAALGGAGKVANAALGVTTGVGDTPLAVAAKAGAAGGEKAAAFKSAMREAAPMESVIADAKDALATIRQNRQAAYQAGMADLGKDNTVLDFGKIDAAMVPVRKVKEFQGKTTGLTVSLEPSTKKVVRQIDDVLTQWRSLPPQDFHTPLGFDALKQRIGDIVSKTKAGTAARKTATQAYNIVRQQITAQAPDYARTMKGYEDASNLIREMESTLSLNPKASIDTQLRKLQSVMRNNVNTAWGRRLDLVKMLKDAGAEHIMEKLAGQSLSSLAPRGLARTVAGGLGLAGGGASLLNPAMWPIVAGQLALQSPRLMGEAAFAAGRSGRLLRGLPIRPLVRGVYQTRGADQERIRP